MTLSLNERFAGCVIGQCLADALGAPVEGQDGATCRVYADYSLRPWFDGKPPDEAIFSGRYTDDSQMARELLLSLVECHGWAPDDYSTRIQHLFKSNLVVGRGLACDAAVRRLLDGVSWDYAGEPAPSAGNGTAMRAAPVGLVFYDQLEMMVEIARQQGHLTHHDLRCAAGSIAIAGAVALLVNGDFHDVHSFTSQLANWMAPYHEEFAGFVRELPELLSLAPERAVPVIAGMGRQPGHTDFWPGISPFVIPSVVWSLYAFLRHPDSYTEAVIDAIVCGGDVDTTAAMTGALSGAHLGIEAVPAHLVDLIHDHRSWTAPQLRRLADEAALLARR